MFIFSKLNQYFSYDVNVLSNRTVLSLDELELLPSLLAVRALRNGKTTI